MALADDARVERRTDASESFGCPPEYGLRVGMSGLTGRLEDLWPEELAYVESSVHSRQIDFASGRVLARRLLEELGFSGRAIERDADHVPLWPEGVLGSISHTDGACLVALSPCRSLQGGLLRGLGVDVEMNEPRSVRFLERITTRAERSRFGTDAAAMAQATRIFGIKEAVYKACFPVLREKWGFRDVEIELDPVSGRFEARVPASANGRVEGFQRQRDGRFWTLAWWR